MNNASADPVMDAKYAAFVANGLDITSPQDAGLKQWIANAHGSLLALLNGVHANVPFGINGTNNLNLITNNNLITLTGTAPVEVRTIQVNGVEYVNPWTSVSNWTVQAPVGSTSNLFSIQGFDSNGNALSNALVAVTVDYTGLIVPPQGVVVINEIMHNPAVPGASYVEIFNTSTNFNFDLSNWRVDGLGFTFPAGFFITNRQYLVLARNRLLVLNTYTNNIFVAGEFNGQINPAGETLSLVQPGPTLAQDVIVNRVRYEASLPWPASANGFGAALQLIDASQDNSRVSNWSDGSGWRFASVTGPVSSSKLFLYLESKGDLYVDDLSLVAGRVPEAGINLLRNGDFEGPLTTNVGGPWVFTSTNLAMTSISATIKHLGNGSLHLAFPAAGSSTVYMYQDSIPVASGTTYTLSFWYLPTTNATIFTTRLGSLVSRTSVRPIFFTPGAANSVTSLLPPYPPLWLNELQADNVTGLTDNAGELDPWLELYNAGPNALSLDGLFLANNYSNLTQWAFPTGLVINPQEFRIIFADGQSEQSATNELHTNFRLTSGSGSLALSRIYSAQPQVLDYLNYHGVPAGHSYGSFPDGQPFARQEFVIATPGATNNGTAPPIVVYINEWMASNTRTITNADNNGKFDDWFELFNPGPNAANLSGCYLTHKLSNKVQFRIPDGYAIPAQGYLMVWADSAPSLNSPSRPDLHVSFNLARPGDAIGLFAPDGTQIDAVTFGAQTSDISQGRYPDGVGPIYFLALATPPGPNTPPGNTPPVLQTIGDQIIDELTRLKFTVLATDSDLPPQTLTFSLDAGAPAGASISPTGLFKWRPTERQGPGLYHITVRVADDGLPSLSASQTFSVTVNEVNSAPSFINVRDKYVKAGALLSFFTGVDSDWPPQNLAFTLEAGAAQGANVDPSSGLFSWLPSDSQAPGTYSVTVRVIDDGIPPLSADAIYTIHVLERSAALILMNWSRSDNSVVLNWETTIGQAYQVEYKNQINQAGWIPLGSSQIATSATLSITDNFNSQRFYHVLLLP